MVAYEPLVETTRGGHVESLHVGALVAVASDGTERWRLGNPSLLSFPRSSLKPFQLLALVDAGGVERFGLDTTDLAIAAASHSGEDVHLQTVRRLLDKIDAPPSALACGAHEPIDAAAAARLAERGEAPTALHNDCSGKHAAMLALARLLRAPLDGYIELNHPVQRVIRAVLVEVLDLDPNDLVVGLDGCSAPAYAVPLARMARGFAWLGQPSAAPPRWRAALERVSAAMRLHPELVGGSHGRVCTELMRAGHGALVAKVGAEGYFGMGHRDGLGVAFKIMDGDAAWRARSVVAVAVAERLGWVAAGGLGEHGPCVAISNWAGRPTGEVRPAAALNTRGEG